VGPTLWAVIIRISSSEYTLLFILRYCSAYEYPRHIVAPDGECVDRPSCSVSPREDQSHVV
jgi:hypothetical protein